MQLLTISEAISYLRTSKSAFYRAKKEGIIKVVKPLHKPMVIKEQIDQLIKGAELRNA